MRKAVIAVMLLLVTAPAWPGCARAADVKVLSTGNMATILADITGEFERMSGHRLMIEYGSTTRIKSRVEANEPADLTINERFVLEDLLHQARIAPGTIVDIARSPLAIAVRSGAAIPDVSTVEGLRRTLLSASSIAYPDPSGGAQDGTYFVNLMRYLGIADQLKPRIKLTMGGDAAAKTLASGGAQIGVAQRRNFISVPGVVMLEPLPQLPGKDFLMVAGVLAGAHEPDAAMALAKFLASPAVAPIIRARGMEPYGP
jgi:molybdate transport system substrate-binding protein